MLKILILVPKIKIHMKIRKKICKKLANFLWILPLETKTKKKINIQDHFQKKYIYIDENQKHANLQRLKDYSSLNFNTLLD